MFQGEQDGLRRIMKIRSAAVVNIADSPTVVSQSDSNRAAKPSALYEEFERSPVRSWTRTSAPACAAHSSLPAATNRPLVN